MRRLTWFAAGGVCGVVGAAYVHTWLREVRGPAAADRASAVVARVAHRAGATARQAWIEGREAMAEADEQIRSDLDDRSRHRGPSRRQTRRPDRLLGAVPER